MGTDSEHRGIYHNGEEDRKEKSSPLESSTATAYTGMSRTHPTVERYLIHLGKSERHSLHDPANQRNPERDKEEIPLESEELQLPLTPQDLWQTGLQHEQRKLRTCPCQADGTVQP